jgi:hypothetical protein
MSAFASIIAIQCLEVRSGEVAAGLHQSPECIGPAQARLDGEGQRRVVPPQPLAAELLDGHEFDVVGTDAVRPMRTGALSVVQCAEVRTRKVRQVGKIGQAGQQVGQPLKHAFSDCFRTLPLAQDRSSHDQ